MKTIAIKSSPKRKKALTANGLSFIENGKALIVDMPKGSEDMFQHDFIRKYTYSK